VICGNKYWQAIGEQSASSCKNGQTIVKQLSNSSQTVVGAKGRVGEFASCGRWGICSLRIAVNLPEDPSGGEFNL